MTNSTSDYDMCALTKSIYKLGYFEWVNIGSIVIAVGWSTPWIMLFGLLYQVKTMDPGVNRLMKYWTFSQAFNCLYIAWMYLLKNIQMFQPCGLAMKLIPCALFQLPYVFITNEQRYIILIVAVDRLRWTYRVGKQVPQKRHNPFHQPKGETTSLMSNASIATLITIGMTWLLFSSMIVDLLTTEGSMDSLSAVCTTLFLYGSLNGQIYIWMNTVVDLSLPFLFFICLRKNMAIRDRFIKQGVAQTLSMRTTLKRNITVSFSLLLVTIATTFIILSYNVGFYLLGVLIQDVITSYTWAHALYNIEVTVIGLQAIITFVSLDALRNKFKRMRRSPSVVPVQPAIETITMTVKKNKEDKQVAAKYFAELQSAWDKK